MSAAALEALVQNKRAVYERMQEARARQQETADAGERFRQTERLRILRGMYRDLCAEIERRRGPEEKRRKTPQRRVCAAGALPYDFFERWAGASGAVQDSRWDGLEAAALTASQARLLRQLVENVAASLPERTGAYFTAHLQGETAAEIARRWGVRPSSVSRALHRAEDRLFRAVCAHGYIGECMTGEGFDLLRFAARAQLLTDRQRELLYLLLTDRVTMADAAAVIDRNKATVCRTNERIAERFGALCLSGYTVGARRVDRREWQGWREKEIAERLGLRPAFYYRYICRDERVGPYSRYVYEILKQRGRSVQEAAAVLGVGARTVAKYRRRYPGVDVSALPEPEPYRPRPPQYPASAPSLRRAVGTIGGSAIGDAVSAETYQRMLRLSVESERSDCMSYYGEKWAVNGLHCGLIHPDYGTKGQYVLHFERCFAKLSQIEQVDWAHLTVRWLPEDRAAEELVLPEGYAFEVVNITYDHKLKTYRVTIRTAAQYLGDVTAYQAEIDALTARCGALEREAAQLGVQLREADEMVIALYEASLTAPEEKGDNASDASADGEVMGA